MKRLITLSLLAVCGLFAAQQVQAQVVVTINSPSGIAGQVPDVGQTGTGFGGELSPGESVTGDLVITLTDDDPADSLVKWQGCDTLINPGEVAGKIAMVRRGGCFFSDKVFHSQLAGAVGVIICNNAPGGGTITMGSGGDYAGLATVPAVMLTYEECETIFAEINAGTTVNVTFAVPGFLDHVLAYSHHTPVSQILDMDAISARLINTSGGDATNITVSCDITDPDGNAETLEVTVDFLGDGLDTTVTFPPYTPTVEGEYTAVFSNSLTSDIISDIFVITDNLFATDRGNATSDAGNQDSYVAGGYRYHYGSLYLTGETPANATHISFGVGNAADIFTGDPDFDYFTVVLYDADADMDDTLDDFNTFDDLDALALGQYNLTGNEGSDEVLTVEISSVFGDPVVALEPGHAYYAVIKYDGDEISAPTSPRLIGTNDVNYPLGLTTPLLLDQLYSGWAGFICVSRLHIDATSGVNVTALDKSKINVYPNPANEYVNLDLRLEKAAEKVQIDILNYDGKVVGSQTLNNVQEGVFDFNTQSLPAGIYFLSVKTPEGYRSLPFTVVH